MKKVLINCSNHASDKWSEEQKAGWDKIVDIPFPNVPANVDSLDKEFEEIIDKLRKQIVTIQADHYGDDVYIMLMGEFSLCYEMFRERLTSFIELKWVVPTTERVVSEVVRDGKTEKKVEFRFVRWRQF